jgi:hypothetical protein
MESSATQKKGVTQPISVIIEESNRAPRHLQYREQTGFTTISIQMVTAKGSSPVLE